MTVTLLLCPVGVGFATPIQQDEEEDSQRRLWNLQFREARAGKKKAATNPTPAAAKTNTPPKPDAPASASVPVAKPAVSAAVTEAAVEGELVGVTVWRLRSVVVGEPPDKARLLLQQGNQFVPERANSTETFTTRDRVRLGFEVPRREDSFLYVIDQEVYADSSLSDPYLIFPQASTRMGDNIVKAGKIVEIPARTDQYPFFDLSLPALRKDRVAERLTVIMTPQPLTVAPGNGPVKLDAAQFEQWQKQWGGTIEKRDAKAGAGNNWTIPEKESGEGKRLLLQHDPLPQTIYQIKVKSGGAALIQLTLTIVP